MWDDPGGWSRWLWMRVFFGGKCIIAYMEHEGYIRR
jgi:hypothetical protein